LPPNLQTKQLCCSNKTQSVQTIKEKSLKSGDFSLFICVCAKKAVPLQRNWEIWPNAPINEQMVNGK
jgi:hypothetical protein